MAALLRRVAVSLDELGDFTVQDIAFHAEPTASGCPRVDAIDKRLHVTKSRWGGLKLAAHVARQTGWRLGSARGAGVAPGSSSVTDTTLSTPPNGQACARTLDHCHRLFEREGR